MPGWEVAPVGGVVVPGWRMFVDGVYELVVVAKREGMPDSQEIAFCLMTALFGESLVAMVEASRCVLLPQLAAKNRRKKISLSGSILLDCRPQNSDYLLHYQLASIYVVVALSNSTEDINAGGQVGGSLPFADLPGIADVQCPFLYKGARRAEKSEVVVAGFGLAGEVKNRAALDRVRIDFERSCRRGVGHVWGIGYSGKFLR